MHFAFTVRNWTFWSPNCSLTDILSDYSKIPTNGEESPPIDFVPMLTRRRFSQLTKLFFYAAHELLPDGEQVPIFFVSKYGEINRQYAISTKLIADEEVQPASFGFSIFNAAPALFCIHQKNQQSTIAINCSENTLETGLLTALSAVNSSDNKRVMLIFAEEKIPEPYEKLTTDSLHVFAAGFLLDCSEPRFSLEYDCASQNIPENAQIPNFIRFLHQCKHSPVAPKAFCLNGIRIITHE